MAREAKKETPLTTEEKLAKALVPEEEQPYPVPENWCWVRLSRLSSVISKGTTPTGGKTAYLPTGIKFLRVENICDDGLISHDGIKYISESMHNTFLKRSQLQEGDVLISIAGTLGKTALVRDIDTPLNTNQAISFVRLKDGCCHPKFIKLCLDNPIINNSLLSQTKVTAIPNLTLEIIGKCPIPLPPLPEQQRIVTLIESLFADLDAAKEKLQAVLDGFAQRRDALLYQAFTGELTREWREEQGVGLKSWENVCIGDIADVKGGKRVPKGMSLVSENTGHPYIKAGNLKNGTVVPDNVMYVPADVLQHIKQYTVNSGDVYITNVGACIGDCGIIPPEFNGANLTENAVKLTGLRCDSLFLARYLSSKPIQIDIKNRIASATLGKLSIANIKKIPVNLPPLPEQKKIVRILDDIFVKESQSKATVESALAKIDTMKKAILATAFRGGFETNDSSDESAKELLRRVL